MPKLPELIPDAETLISLTPEELAKEVLVELNTTSDAPRTPREQLSRLFAFRQNYYPHERQGPIETAILEAWSWLERAGLIAEKHPLSTPREYFVTRRGKEISSAPDFERYRQASMFPRELVHHTIAEKCFSLFVRGEYDTAVFQAFKEVEVAVRAAGGYDATMIGVGLMRVALHPGDGHLTDQSAPPGEKQGLSDLFAGAIGMFKNPGSHSVVNISEPGEAIEMIMLASLLLRIVDRRARDAASCGDGAMD